LVGRALGAAIGSVEIERTFLADARAADRRIMRNISIIRFIKRDIRQIAIYLVGRGEDEGNRRVSTAQRVEQIQCPADIDLEILARIDEARRHGHLGRHMKNCLSLAGRLGHSLLVAHVADNNGNLVGMPLPEPFEIALDAWTDKLIENENVMTFAGEAIRKIGADETGAAGHENRTTAKNCRCTRVSISLHATRPRASSSLRAS
jgi:hypothetical protein